MNREQIIAALLTEFAVELEHYTEEELLIATKDERLADYEEYLNAKSDTELAEEIAP